MEEIGMYKSHYVLSCSVVSDSVTPWTIAHQAPLSMRFLRQENWSRLPFLSPGDLPDSGNKPRSPAWQVDSLPLHHLGGPSTNITLHYMKSLSRVRLFATPWIVAYQAPLFIFQARVLEWITISFSKGSSQPRDRTWVSRIVDRGFTV